jgi:hypothetical protein
VSVISKAGSPKKRGRLTSPAAHSADVRQRQLNGAFALYKAIPFVALDTIKPYK